MKACSSKPVKPKIYLALSKRSRLFRSNQVAELQVRVAVMNGFTALGIPVTEAVG
tara:strand:- start:369 stop:533 length:165 start_codon:yes stop_codon:yes gene_type:complete